MASYLDLICEIQKLDENLDHLEQEIGRLPKHVEEIEKKLEDHKAQLAVEKHALEFNEKERRRLEGGVALAQEKSTRLQEQIAEVKTNDQYRALRNEISFAKKEIRTLRASQQSPMPTDLLSDLAPQDAADLLAFLQSFGGAGN